MTLTEAEVNELFLTLKNSGEYIAELRRFIYSNHPDYLALGLDERYKRLDRLSQAEWQEREKWVQKFSSLKK